MTYFRNTLNGPDSIGGYAANRLLMLAVTCFGHDETMAGTGTSSLAISTSSPEDGRVEHLPARYQRAGVSFDVSIDRRNHHRVVREILPFLSDEVNCRMEQDEWRVV